jgi:hypothetical protein
MPPFTAYSGHHFERHVALSPQQVWQVGICTAPLQDQEIPVSGAAVGERGRCGARTGSSSGTWPGSSSGRGGSPGSRSGGGTSGRGFPGGLSCGGSDGCPGLIGGSSCGSIGISRLSSFELMDQRRCAGNVPAAWNVTPGRCGECARKFSRGPTMYYAGSTRKPARGKCTTTSPARGSCLRMAMWCDESATISPLTLILP